MAPPSAPTTSGRGRRLHRARRPCRSTPERCSDARMGYRIGVDVGGTFTDLVLVAPEGALVVDKHPTTPADQSEGVLAGIGLLAARVGLARDALLARTDLV